jgi:Zn-dependent protease/CBS domain-containing protein
MSWSFPIGSLGGTVVRVHYTLLIFLMWIGLVYFQAGGAHAAASGIVFIVLVFVCVTAHEFGHVLVAKRYGVRTPDIVLMPIGGASRMEKIPENPKQEALIGIAGPLVSLAIGALLVVVLGRFPNAADFAPDKLGAQLVSLPQLAVLNLMLAAFNLLPAFPLDGGRVLRAALATRMGRMRATRTAARIGQGFALLFGLLGFASGNLILVLIAAFVFFAASSENGAVRLETAARALSAADAMITHFETLAPDATLDAAAHALISTTQAEFPVVDAGGRLHGFLTRKAIVAGLKEDGRSAPVSGRMTSDIPVIGPAHALDAPVTDALNKAPAVAVLDAGNRLVGYITLQNLVESMMIAETPGARPRRASPWAQAEARFERRGRQGE